MKAFCFLVLGKSMLRYAKKKFSLKKLIFFFQKLQNTIKLDFLPILLGALFLKQYSI